MAWISSLVAPRFVWRAALCVALIATAMVFGGRAAATVMVEVPFEDMVVNADAIVRGTVARTGVHMRVRAGSFDPVTVTELRVAQWWKGPGGPTVRIEELGGEVAGEGRWIAGTPRYARGEEVIVFLRRRPDGSFATYGMVQGKFRVMHGVPGVPTAVRRDLEGASFASWNRDGMQLRHGATPTMMTLDTFVATLEGVLDSMRALTRERGAVR